MGNPRKFVVQNPVLLLRDGLALFLSIHDEDEIATRQLLREYETAYPTGYGRQVTVKTISLLNADQKTWLKQMY